MGGNDRTVIDLNEEAARLLNCPHELSIVPEATHLFEEPGALERVAELAGQWFATHLPHTDERLIRGRGGGAQASV